MITNGGSDVPDESDVSKAGREFTVERCKSNPLITKCETGRYYLSPHVL